MDNAIRFDVRCMLPANTTEGDVWYCVEPLDHDGAHRYQPWHRHQKLCRCADEVRFDLRSRVRELEESERYQRDLANQMDAARVKAEHLGRLDRERAHELEAERDRLQADLDALNYDGMLTLRAERDRLREAAEERWGMIECTDDMTLRNMNELALEGCRFFYLRPRRALEGE